jgi:hypothetical protein
MPHRSGHKAGARCVDGSEENREGEVGDAASRFGGKARTTGVQGYRKL